MAFFQASNRALYFKFIVNEPEHGRMRRPLRIDLLSRNAIIQILRVLLIAAVLIVIATLIGDAFPNRPFGSEKTVGNLVLASIVLLALTCPLIMIGRRKRIDFATLRLDTRLTQVYYWFLAAVTLEVSITGVRAAYGSFATRIIFWATSAAYFLAFTYFISKPTRVERNWQKYGGTLV